MTTAGVIDADNAFFQDLGTNGRRCVTCHQSSEAWTITPAGVEQRFAVTEGLDPLFRSVDGSNCAGAVTDTVEQRREAYSLLLARGVIRIDLEVPAGAEFARTTTDPGRALLTGRCNDIGKFKGPILRALAARAPYFHDGSAAGLADLIEFYDTRVEIGLTAGEKTDLRAFLRTL